MAPYCCFCLQASRIFLLHTLMALSSLRVCFEQKQNREEICTMKDLSEGFSGFKSVRLITLEDRRLPRSFNDRACDTNKMDKFNNNNSNNNNNNNNKVSASCNHSSYERTVD